MSYILSEIHTTQRTKMSFSEQISMNILQSYDHFLKGERGFFYHFKILLDDAYS